MDKTIASLAEAVAPIGDGATVMIGGFGGSGAPIELIHALIEHPPRSGRPGQVTSHTIDWVEPSSRTSGFDVRF